MNINGATINGATIDGSSGLLVVASSLVNAAYTLYTCVLTGSPDLTLPISSISIRKRDAEPSYCSVVVPALSDGATDFVTEIDARSNGELVISQTIHYLDGGSATGEIIRVDLEDVNSSEGARSRSIVLSGHSTNVTAPKQKTVIGSSFRGVTNGQRRFRAAVDFDLNPGDTADVDAEQFIVEAVTITIGSAQRVMEFSELL